MSPEAPAPDPRAGDREEFLAAFDAQMRGPVAMRLPAGGREEMDGPVYRSWGWSERGFVMISPTEVLPESDLKELVERQLRHFQARSIGFEWKTFSHDRAPGLEELLVQAGFVTEERESLLIGRVADVDQTARLPPGVSLRQVRSRADAERMAQLLTLVDGEDRSPLGQAFFNDWAANPEDVVLLVAEADGEVVGTSRLNLIPGSDFASLWAGSTLAGWRHRGIYRATVAHRARLARERGLKYLYVDASEESRPILERLGLLRVAVTIPYVWLPPG
ncbi:MAG TPA: GNAT family N-acetyltransferase [Candidatus Dormibacteraeota bacterium]